MTQNNQAPDRDAAERALIELLGACEVRREALADDALWSLAPVAASAPDTRREAALAHS